MTAGAHVAENPVSTYGGVDNAAGGIHCSYGPYNQARRAIYRAAKGR